MDTIFQLLCVPNFVADVFVNFDVHLYGNALLEALVAFLTRTALGTTSASTASGTLSLDAGSSTGSGSVSSGTGDEAIMSVPLIALNSLLAALAQTDAARFKQPSQLPRMTSTELVSSALLPSVADVAVIKTKKALLAEGWLVPLILLIGQKTKKQNQKTKKQNQKQTKNKKQKILTCFFHCRCRKIQRQGKSRTAVSAIFWRAAC